MNLTGRLGWTCLHSLWQGAAIGLSLALALVLMRHRGAAARHTLCLASLVFMLLSAAITFIRLPSQNATSPPSAATVNAASKSTPPIVEAPNAPELAVFNDKDQLPIGVSDSLPDSLPDAPNPVSTWQQRLNPCLPWIAMGWLSGVILFTLRHVGAWFRLCQWRAAGIEVDPGVARITAHTRRRRMGEIVHSSRAA